MESRPVIIGSSLTGLLISNALSQQGIAHVLIGGDRPKIQPRLGESMNEGASVALWQSLGLQYQKHFYPKSHISLCNGPFATMLKTGSPHRCFEKLSIKLSDRQKKSGLNRVLNSLSHLDRSEFDPEFYDDTIASRYCELIKNSQVSVTVDAETDRVTKIKYETQGIDSPRFVFDATGPRGIVAEAANVKTDYLTDHQRVVWTHLSTATKPDPQQIWWLNGTNLVRLDRQADLIDGMAWAIPMGKRLSIGLSVDAKKYPSSRLSTDDLVARLIWAYERRGMNISKIFEAQDHRGADITHRYFKRQRAFGANWFLAGGTYQQVWFPTSSGVSTSTLAARIAPQLIDDVSRWGIYYQNKMAAFLPFHEFLDDMITGEPWQLTSQGFHFWADWTAGSFKRVASDLQIQNDEADSKKIRYALLKNLGMAIGRNKALQFVVLGSIYSRVKAVSNLEHSSNALQRFYFVPWLSKISDGISAWPRYWLSRVRQLFRPKVEMQYDSQTLRFEPRQTTDDKLTKRAA